MFSHIQIGARNLPVMITFYDAVLPLLGLVRIEGESDDGGPDGAGWQMPGTPWPQFYVQLPFDGAPASAGNGTQVSFAAPSQAHVQMAWQAALAAGGRDEGAPGLRPHYGPDYYGAYCRDPEGNKLCFVYANDLWQGRK